nr:reverse transcriptase domain-containing protein [Tanacetum cinerariifolium]GEX50329.1 reverse transcriptase domain-containing protein [Tanacetum cinerariifolium]
MKTKPIRKTIALAESSNDSKLMEKMEAFTTKIDSQFKDIKGEMKEMRDGYNSCGGPHPLSKCVDKPMGGPKEEEANYAYGGYRGRGYQGNYYGRSSGNYPNANTTVIHDDNEDEVNEVEKEAEPSFSKQTKSDPPPLKAINVPLVNVLAGMPNYGKFLKSRELDALLDDSKPISTTSEKISESFLDHEFKELMAIKIKEIPKQEEEVEDNFEKIPAEENLRIKNSIQDPPTDLVNKLLPKHLEYAFLEKESLLPAVISALLKDDEKKRLVSVLKKHKEAFAWKTSDIPVISPSF